MFERRNAVPTLPCFVPHLLAILFEEPELEALIELHLFVLPEFVGVRVRRTDGGELRTDGSRGSAMERGALAATHARLRARRLRRL